MVSLFCCAFCGGVDEPLAIVIEPVPLGLTSVTDSASCAATAHPSGRGTATPALEADVGDGTVGCGEGTGLGEPAGDGLDSSLTSLAAWLLAWPKPTASTVPTPAITSTNTTTTAMIATHGVRWTGGWMAPVAAE